MRTLLEKKKSILKGGIIILLVISVIGNIIQFITGYTPNMDSQSARFWQTVIFYNITDGNDTCLVSGFHDWAYEELNIKVVDRQSFDSYFLTKVLHNEIIEVSEEYLQQQKPYSIKPVESINNLYETYGLDSLLKYLEEYPIDQLHKDDLDSFYWGAYLLWQNNIYVAEDGEVYYWYIDYGE